MRKRKQTKINCKNCGIEHEVNNSEIRKGYGIFCSQKCNHEHKNKNFIPKIHEPNVKCSKCNKEFYKSLSRLKQSKSGLYFCSRVCKDEAQRIENGIITQQYKNGINRYRQIAFRNNQIKCNRCGYEKNISVLQVHHIDRNRDNNHLSNLEILCLNCHAEEHFIDKERFFAK